MGYARYNTRLHSFYSDFHGAINAIKPPFVSAEELASRTKAAEEELVSRGKKQLESALNAVAVPNEQRQDMLDKYGQKWKLKPVDIRVGVSTGLYVPDIRPKEKNWAKHADEALDKAKARDGKNGIAVYYEEAGRVLSAGDVSSKCLKPSLYKFYEQQKQ